MKKLLLFLSLLLCSPMMAQQTLLSGTLNNPDGTGFNGQLIMSLAQQSAISSAGSCGGPVFVPSTVQIVIKVVNGTMQSPPHIYGSDCTLPYGVPYNVIARDNNGNVDFTAQWLPIGSNQNIGTIQSVVNPLGTLFGLTLSDLALTGAANTFTANNTFADNVTIDGSLTLDGTLYGPTNGPLVVQGTGGSLDFEVLNTAGTPLFLVYDSGLVQTTAAFQAAGVIDANEGFTYNGSGGTTGQCLVSNGTAFIPGTCNATYPTIYYQTVDANGTGQTQRSKMNFASRFALTDSGANNWTSVDLATSGVTAGTYTNATVAVDSYGRVTSASSGGSSQTIQTATVTSGICTTPQQGQVNTFLSCGTSVQWPTPFADANYVATCSAGTPTNLQLTGTWINNISASGLTFNIANGDSNGGNHISVLAIYCIGVHP